MHPSGGLCASQVVKWVKVAQSCLTLCNPMDYTRNQTRVSCIAGWFFTNWAIWEALPGGARGKECLTRQEMQETRVQSLGQGKIPWNRKSQPEPIFLSRKSHGQRNLAGYSLCGQRESDNDSAAEQASRASTLEPDFINSYPALATNQWDGFGQRHNFTVPQFLSCVVLRAQSHPTLCDPMDCSPLGSSVHGIFQARILEQVALSYARGSSQLKDRTHVSCVSCLAVGFFTIAPALQLWNGCKNSIYFWFLWGFNEVMSIKYCEQCLLLLK